MITNRICSLLLLTLLPFMGFAQKQDVAISFQALPDSLAKHPKPIVINVYTNWCTYCMMQENGIKKSAELSSLLGKEMYYLRLNAEEKERIFFNHEQYHFQPNGPSSGIHELVLALGKGNKELAYPMWFILDADYQVEYSFSGYLRPGELNALLMAYLKEKKNRSSDQVYKGVN